MGEVLLRVPYTPHEFQDLFHAAPERIKAAICGARSGKTLGIGAECVNNCIFQPGFSKEMADAGLTYDVAVGAPTYRMIRRNILGIFLRLMPKKLVIGKYHQTENILRVKGRYGITQVSFLSTKDPESWQGQDLFGVWLDEFALMKELMFDEAQTRLANKRGWLLLSGTPRGPGWVKKRIYDFAHSSEGQGKIFVISWKTSDNPTFPKEELEEKRRTMPPKYFRRTYEASLESFQGQVYEDFTAEKNIRARSEFKFILPGGRRIIGTGPREVRLAYTIAGVDWGYSNPGAIVVVGVTETGQRIALDLSYGSGVEVVTEDPIQDSWIKRARELNTKWGIESFFCGADQPGHIKSFKKAGLKAMSADTANDLGIQSVATLFRAEEEEGEGRLILLSDLEKLIEEITYYHWKEDSDGQQGDAPEKLNDHACDALRYAIYSSTRRRRFRREPNYRKGAA